MATRKWFRKGAWQYSTSPKEYPTKDCPVCQTPIATNNFTKHLNAHVRRGGCQRHEYNGQTIYILDGMTVYVRG